MKKSVYLMSAAVAMIALASCSGNNGKCSGDKECKLDKKELYTGVLPAADAAGIRYQLKLDWDDDNCNEGDYDLRETQLVSDTTSVAGVTDGKTFDSEGDFTVMKGSGENAGKTYLKLVRDTKDSDPESNAGPMYFLVESDSTLVMVNADLQVSENPELNYTLKLQK